jgi:putative membrane-bound dehydrogenase-like protein
MRPFLSLLLLGTLLTAVAAPPADKPVPPNEAAARMTLPEGFRATLFAGEPDLVQPIAFTTDDRGRLWVVECMTYPKWIKDGKPGTDRVLIFEDTTGEGRFTKRTVFADKLTNVTGIALGFGGVWLCATPNLLFIPMKDDKPAGPPEVLLDGWSLNAGHNVFNDLAWGPDGWLYGCNGITDTSKVGKPGTPDDKRIRMNCGVWRFHPTRKDFEIVAWGTTNPWGLDWDDYGQAFITNCVIAHLWHVVPGAHFQRMHGQDLNPNVYSLLPTCADHIHWAGGHWTSARGQAVHSESGGGHAHAGAMVYLGDNWPDRYRNGVFTCNIHGNRVNHDILERRGSGYVAHHGKDFLLANDPWFRGLTLQYGPDGAVYASDWCDTGECHNYDKVHISGRIFKVTYGKPAYQTVDLEKLPDAELVKLQLHKNDWQVRHARRLLQERAAAGKLEGSVHPELRKILAVNPDVTRKLRALWTLHATGGLDEGCLIGLLNNPHEQVRAWAIALGLEPRQASPAFRTMLAEMAARDPSAFVRLYLASGLQRLPLADRWPIAQALALHAEDDQDAYLPLMLWYGVEPLPPADPERAVNLLRKTSIGLLREHIARRLATLPEANGKPSLAVDSLVKAMHERDDPALHRDILRGITEALRGRRQAAMPGEWKQSFAQLVESPYAEVREKAIALAVLFGDEQALTSLRKLAVDVNASAASRLNALQTLIQKQQPETAALLQGLLTDPVLRGPALRGLASFADDQTPTLILKHFAALSEGEKGDAVATLASRPAWALALLEAIERKQVAKTDLSAFTVRQMVGLNNKAVADKLNQVWGPVRPASADKAAQMAKYKALLTPDVLKKADRSQGRLVYQKVCGQCHRLFDDGGAIGPELTGSQRANLDYLLENILDPSAIVPAEYQMSIIATKSGRVLNGIIKKEDDRTVTVQTQNEAVILPKDEIEDRQKSPISLMPEGLLDKLTPQEVRDLVAYVAGANQVPAAKEAKK